MQPMLLQSNQYLFRKTFSVHIPSQLTVIQLDNLIFLCCHRTWWDISDKGRSHSNKIR